MFLLRKSSDKREGTITTSYYRGAHAFFVVYDITDKVSFENTKQWLMEIDKYGNMAVDKVLIGTKCDLTAQRAVETAQGQALAEQCKIPFLEVSSKTGENVELMFLNMTKEVVKRLVHRFCNCLILITLVRFQDENECTTEKCNIFSSVKRKRRIRK